jgi:tetratricopeptide (TPR) repeat protein
LITRFQGSGEAQLLGALHDYISLVHTIARGSEERSPAWLEHAAEAAKHATEAARLCPRDVDALYRAANATEANKDYAASFKYANAILSIAVSREQKIHGHLALAAVYHSSGIYDQEMKELRHVIELDENNTNAMRQMAVCLHMGGRPKEAIGMAKRCLLANPGDEICLLLVERIKPG